MMSASVGAADLDEDKTMAAQTCEGVKDKKGKEVSQVVVSRDFSGWTDGV